MTPRILTVVVLLVAIAAGAFFFLWSGPSPVSPPDSDAVDSRHGDRTVRSAVKEPAARTAGGREEKVDWDSLLGLGDGKEREIPKEADIVSFLAKHGETPANLVAAFEIAKDRRWLDRALELFPNSPLVLMKAIEAAGSKAPPKEGEVYQVSAEKLALIERFKAADPNNPVPWIFAAQEFFKAKQTADALADIRAALDRPAFYTYANERTDSAQRLYESTGIGQVEASALAMFGLTLPHMSAAQQASRGLMELQKSATGSGDAAAADEALRLTYSLGRTFATPEASRLLIGQLVGLSMEKRALEALPADAQRDWLKVVPSERLAQIEKERAVVKEVTAVSEWAVKERDEQLVTEWLRRLRDDGELSALTWLKTQRK